MRSLAGMHTPRTHLPTAMIALTWQTVTRRVTTISPRCATFSTYLQRERQGDLVQLLSNQGVASALEYMQQ